MLSYLPLLHQSGLECTVKEIKSKFKQSQLRSRSSPRPLNWLDNVAPLNWKNKLFQLQIQRLLEGYQREDPPSIPELAVPISIPNTYFDTAIDQTIQKNKLSDY